MKQLLPGILAVGCILNVSAQISPQVISTVKVTKASQEQHEIKIDDAHPYLQRFMLSAGDAITFSSNIRIKQRGARNIKSLITSGALLFGTRVRPQMVGGEPTRQAGSIEVGTAVIPSVLANIHPYKSNGSIYIGSTNKQGERVSGEEELINIGKKWSKIRHTYVASEDEVLEIQLKSKSKDPIILKDTRIHVDRALINVNKTRKALRDTNSMSKFYQIYEQEWDCAEWWEACQCWVGCSGGTGGTFSGVTVYAPAYDPFPINYIPVSQPAFDPSFPDYPANPELPSPWHGPGMTSTGRTKLIGKEANPCELVWALSHTSEAIAAKWNSNTVSELIDDDDLLSGWGGSGPDGTRANAAKHFLWCALNVCSMGVTDAESVAVNHEICLGVKETDDNNYNMDTHNNAAGITYGINLVQMGKCNSWGEMLAYIINEIKKGSGVGVVKWLVN